MVGGHDLDATGRRVEEFAVLVGRGAKRFLDEHNVAQVVVASQRREVGGRRGGDVGDHV